MRKTISVEISGEQAGRKEESLWTHFKDIVAYSNNDPINYELCLWPEFSDDKYHKWSMVPHLWSQVNGPSTLMLQMIPYEGPVTNTIW